jgi:LPS sulfotransferase NodH
MTNDPHEHGERLPGHRKNDAAEALLVAANAALQNAPLPHVGDAEGAAAMPIVYIVGVPRSGTTLLHQLAAGHLDVGYVDNVAARFWLRPSVGLAVSRAVQQADDIRRLALVSTHGGTEGSAGPHEFGYFWRHWLPLDRSASHHLDATLQAEVDVDGLGNTLRGELLAYAQRPFVFKNVICGFHASLLTRAHAPSLFVHVTRDPKVCVRSILTARKERYGTYETWWSLKPSTYPFADLSPAEQVVRQVLDCKHEFKEELSAAGVHSVEVRYDDLCAAPADQLERIRLAIEGLGFSLAPVRQPLAPLRASPGPQLPPELEADVDRALTSS